MINEIFQKISHQIRAEIARQKDEVIRRAISNHLGRTDWEKHEVLPRLQVETHQGSVLAFLTMDGEPILATGPMLVKPIFGEDHSVKYQANQGYKILNEPAIDSPA